ncbi:hypothetical protein ACW7GZ_14230 [Luteimonas sp. A537]
MDGNTPLAQSTTTPSRETREVARVAPQPLFFLRPETSEIYVCSATDTSKILAEAALIDELIADMFIAQAATREVETSRQPTAEDLNRALRQEEAARDTLFEELSEIKAFSGGDEMMELVSLPGRENKYKGKTLTYVRSSKVKSHFRQYKLANAEQPEMKSVLVRDESTGKMKIDQKKLQDSLKLTASDVKIKEKIGEHVVAKWAEEWAPEFVREFNRDFNFKREAAASDEADGERTVDFSGGATLLRAFATADVKAGAHVDGTLADALKGKGSIGATYKAKGTAAFALAEGKVALDFYIPDKNGFGLYLPVAGGKDESLGAFRAELGTELSGFVGASVLGEGGLEVSIGTDDKGKQVQGIRGTRAKRRTGQQLKKKKLSVVMEGDLGGEVSAFAGAEGLLAVSGGVSWLKPESRDDFVSFAEVSPSVAAQAGAGGTAAFYIRYRDSKLRIHCKLGACWGLGLKGSIEASVSPLTLGEFVLWFHYQVVNAGSRNLQYFEDRAWDAYLRMQTLAVLKGKRIADFYGQAEHILEERYEEWKEWAKNRPREAIQAIAAGLRQAAVLLPEVRGFLLKMLEEAYNEIKKMGEDVADWFRDLLSAVNVLTDDVYLQNEYKNVQQFASQKLGVKDGNMMAMDTFVGELLGQERLAELHRLKTAPTPGFYTVPNRAFAYRLQNGTHVAWMGNPWWQQDDTRLA